MTERTSAAGKVPDASSPAAPDDSQIIAPQAHSDAALAHPLRLLSAALVQQQHHGDSSSEQPPIGSYSGGDSSLADSTTPAVLPSIREAVAASTGLLHDERRRSQFSALAVAPWTLEQCADFDFLGSWGASFADWELLQAELLQQCGSPEVLQQQLWCSNPQCSNLSGISELQMSTFPCDGGCGVRYCSEECQAQCWVAGHRESCGRLKQLLVQRAVSSHSAVSAAWDPLPVPDI